MPDSKSKNKILATRELPAEMVAQLEEANFNVLQQDFIKVNLEFDPESFSYYLNNPQSQARVFTSKNAVYSLQKLAANRQLVIEKKKNFTVGIRATEMLEELGIKANARAANAVSLAQIIARNQDVKAVDFFCGDKSLDDLPEYLESKRIKVHKEIVYHTELVYEEVETESLNAVIFLSPTAVYSFFKKNSLPPKVPTFSIGATTAEAVRTRCNNKRIEADTPSLQGVIDKVIETFTHEYH